MIYGKAGGDVANLFDRYMGRNEKTLDEAPMAYKSSNEIVGIDPDAVLTQYPWYGLLSDIELLADILDGNQNYG